MREDLLQYVWRTRQFDLKDLEDTEGVQIQILDFGEYNTHAGPDFLNAKIQIGEMLWAGNVEMHVRASDWRRHQHSENRAYENVILHVVFDADESVFRAQSLDNQVIPCLILKGRISGELIEKYQTLMTNENWIPCEKSFEHVSDLTKTMWFERLTIERLERKTTDFVQLFNYNQNDWEETFYQIVARTFGLKINAEPMLWLAQSLPHRVLAKHKNQLFQIEALLFGQAGFLEKIEKTIQNTEGVYPQALKKEYDFLKHKHNLTAINAVSWQFSKLRPPSFPTIRLAQLAGLIYRSSHLFSKVIDCEEVKQIRALFEAEVSPFWHSHFTLTGEASQKPTVKKIGNDFFNTIMINAIVPVLFFYGKYKKEEDFVARALRFLHETEGDKNSLVEQWSNLGVSTHSAYQTQALLELKNEYCVKKRCLSCAIGSAILKHRKTS
ncbi:MAG: DUF2851 family protein [Saprospiraceae bacterium]|nr:DUF2851 family protein [Saprospiraceae bacterium]